MGVKPADLAILILKINVLIFVITLGVNTISLFPYLLHLNQINNNIALDVANRNFVSESDLKKYLEHFTYDYGDTGASTFSILTYKNKGGAINTDANFNEIQQATKDRGVTVFAKDLSFDSKSYTLQSGNSSVVGVNVETIKNGGQSLILDVGDSFNPLNNNIEMEKGIEDGYGKGKIVNRGHAFNVTLKTRYKLTGAAFGFFITTALPVQVDTVGVTTQYYQYDIEKNK